MLEGLKNIDWGQYYHAYGKAVDTPLLIHDLMSNDEQIQEKALYEINMTLAHQGTRWDVSYHAIPFLCELAGNAGILNRDQIVHTLLRIALGNYLFDDKALPFPDKRYDSVQSMVSENYRDITRKFYEGNLSTDEREIANQLAIVWERDAYEALNQYTDNILELALDPDETIAQYAIAVMPWFSAIHQTALPVLIEILISEKSVPTKITALLTSGLLPSSSGNPIESIIRPYLAPQHPRALRLTSAIALTLITGTDIEQETLDVLVESETWRDEINSMPKILYGRSLMGFRSLAINHIGL